MGLSSWWPWCCPANHSSLKGMFAAEWSGESWRLSKVPSKQMGPFGHMCRPHFSMFTLTLKAGKKGWTSQLHDSQTWIGITSSGDLRGTYSDWPHHQTWWFRTLWDGAWRTVFQGHHRKTFGGQQKTITLLSWTVTHLWGVRVSKSILLERLLKLKEIKKILSRPYN